MTVLGAIFPATGCALPNAWADARGIVKAQGAAPKIEGGTDDQHSPGMFDTAEKAITQRVRTTAAWIDAFLSDERSRAEENRSWVAIRLTGSLEEGEGPDADVKLDGRMVLPHTEDRLRVAFGGDPDAEDDSTPVATDPETTSDAEARNPRVALEYVLKRTRSNDIRPEAGVRFRGTDVDVYAGMRWRHEEHLRTWLLRITEKLRSYADAGPEARTTVDLERLLLQDCLFRSSTRGLWRDQEPGYDYGQRFTFFQPLDERTVVSYEWDTSLNTDQDHAVSETALRCRMARRFSRNRVLVEMTPQVAWREELEYAPVLGLFLTIEVSFGRSK